MKRFWLSLLLILTIPSFAFAGFGYKVVPVGSAAAPACSITTDTDCFTRGAGDGISGAFNVYQAVKIVLSAATTITQYSVYGWDQYYDDLRGTTTVALWNGDATDPNANDPITGTSVSATTTWQTYVTQGNQVRELVLTLAVPTAVAAGTYWVVMTYSNGGYPYWVRDHKTGESNRIAVSADGETWTATADYYRWVVVRGCQ